MKPIYNMDREDAMEAIHCYRRLVRRIALLIPPGDSIDVDRASGLAICELCGLELFEHPEDMGRCSPMSLESAAKEWLAARDVIADYLAEHSDLMAGVRRREAHAAAIIARLASHDPPILLEMAKEDD